MNINCVLYLTDFSERSLEALSCLLKRSEIPDNFRLELVHANEHMRVPGTNMTRTYASMEAERDEKGRHAMEEIKRKLIEEGHTAQIHSHVLTGNPLHKVNMIAKNSGADLVVLTRRSEGRVGLLASFSFKVARYIELPTLVIPDSKRYRTCDNMIFACEMNEIRTHDLETVNSVAGFLKKESMGLYVRDQTKEEDEVLSVSSPDQSMNFRVVNSRNKNHLLQNELKKTNSILAIKKSKKSMVEMVFSSSVTRSILLEQGISTLLI